MGVMAVAVNRTGVVCEDLYVESCRGALGLCMRAPMPITWMHRRQSACRRSIVDSEMANFWGFTARGSCT